MLSLFCWLTPFVTFGAAVGLPSLLADDQRQILRSAELVAFPHDDRRQRLEGLTAIHVPGSLVLVELNSRAQQTDQVHRAILLR